MNHIFYNRAIVNKLKELVELYPELRFGQLLWNCEILEWMNDMQIRDIYNDDPEDIWNKMCKNNFAFPK